MKNKLLFTTALAATVFVANGALAENISFSDETLTQAWVDENVTGEYNNAENVFIFDKKTAKLGENVEVSAFTNLFDLETLESSDDAEKTLTVNGFLTTGNKNHNIEGVNLVIGKGAVGGEIDTEVKEQGELVLGTDMTVGNVTMKDGTGLFLIKDEGPYNNNSVKTLTVAGEKSITFEGNNYIDGTEGTSLTFDGEGSVVNNGTLDSMGHGIETAVEIVNNGTIKGNVSSNSNPDADSAGTGNLIMANAASKIIGNVTGTNIYFKNSHTLSEAVKGDLDVSQMMIDNGGSLIANQTFAAKDLVIGSKNGRSGTGSMTLQADASVGGAKVNSGSTLDLRDKTLTVKGGHPQGNDYVRLMDGSTLAFDFGKGRIDGDVNLEGAVNLNPTIAIGTEDGSHEFITGEVTREDKTINDSEFDAGKTGFVGYENNNLYDIVLSDDNKSLDIKKKSTSEIAAATGASANQANAVAAVISGNSSNAVFNEAASNINTLLQSSDGAAVQAGLDAVTALSPEVAPLVQKTSIENTNQVFSAVSTRLTGGTVSTGGEGMASGDSIFKRGAMWVQGLFNKSKLDDTSKAKGFDADSSGIAFGAEKFVTDDTKVGVGYAYTNTDIDGFMRDTDVDTHTAILYGEYKPSNWYVNGIATYGWSDYSEDKSVAGVGVKADYDVETFGLQSMTGYDMQVNGLGVTPEAGLRYVHIKQDAYTDSAGQRVSANDSDILTGVIGAKVSKSWELENGMNIKPEARVAATYDLFNDDVNSVVTLANGSAYAVEGEALDRFGMEFGAGVTAEVNDNVELSLGYEGKFRQDYQDHTGLINAKYKF